MVYQRMIFRLRGVLRQAALGPQMLAFLPAVCLSAYWMGGEFFLVLSALCTPLFYALTGGFSRTGSKIRVPDPGCPTLDGVAAEFLETAHHNGQTTACLQIEVSGLDRIGRVLGDSATDAARRLCKDRLVSALRDGDHVFQTGDSRFVVLLSPGFRLKLDSLLDLAKRLRATLQEPLSLSGTSQLLCAAIGISSSLSFGRNATPESWVNSAADALSEALSTDPSGTRVWSDKLYRQRQSRSGLREDLRIALESGQIQAFFQPQINLVTGRVTGMEALARWDHPTRGVIPPAEFLRTLDDAGLMDRLGATILSQSLAALHRWDADGLDLDTVSVNFCATELRNPALPDQIKWELDRHGLPPHRLVIEVLESVIADVTDDVIRRNLDALARAGCGIDLDDFGTAHASITTLQRFPVQRVKIDRSFISYIDKKPDAQRLLKAMLGMAAQLGLDTLAEGVETVSEHHFLSNAGCQLAQGFLFGPPMPTEEAAQWVAAWTLAQNPVAAAQSGP